MIPYSTFKTVLRLCRDPQTWHNLLMSNLPEHGIETKEQVCRFIAQVAHESGQFNTLEENLNYSGERLLAVFPKYFKGKDVSIYHRNPRAIASYVYANRMGNGDVASEEGYKYRGRGCIMLTGRENYAKYSKSMFNDENVLLEKPEILLDPQYAVLSSLHYWSINNLKEVEDFYILTKKINGGLNGIEDRLKIYNSLISS